MNETDKICALMEFMFKWIYCYGRGLCIRYFTSYYVCSKPSQTCGPKCDAFSWVVLVLAGFAHMLRELWIVSGLGWPQQ